MKRALIIGINAYPTAPLQGCINDLIDYQNTLGAKGFSYVALSDWQATKARILAELRTMVSSARSGDSIAFCYSGHGSYTTDRTGDEPDRKDELLVPIDYQAGQYIFDDELRAELARLTAGVTCDVFADSCYSGTVTRLMPQTHKIPVLGTRYMPLVGKPKKAKAIVVPTLNHALWAACGEGQTSSEVLVSGVPRGVFSYYACKAMRTYPAWSRDQCINYAKQRIAAIGLTQVPQLECKVSEAAQLPFS